MKTSALSQLIASLLLMIILLTTSCRKQNTSFDYNQAIETTAGYVDSQQMTDLLLNTYFKSITDSTLLTVGVAVIDGAKVTYSSNPATIVINYAWCKQDDYGHLRDGSIEATSQTNFFDSLAVVNLNFSNFHYDNDSLSAGNFTITNMGLNSSGNFYFDIKASNINRQTIDTAGNVSNLNYQLQQTFIRHKDTTSVFHTQTDYFDISGSLTGKARNTFAFSSVISDTNTLINSFSCRWLISGGANIELPDFIYNSSVNFSNNVSCTNMYSIITNEILFTNAFDGEQAVCGQ